MEKAQVKFNWRRGLVKFLLIILMYLMVTPFLVNAVEIVRAAIGGETTKKTYLFIAGGTLGNTAMIVHIAFGVALTALAPLQLVGVIRRRFTAFHRVTGVLLVGFALLTSIGGLTFIAIRGTIGGPFMSFGFSLYGICMFVAAVRVIQTALQHDRIRHWQWALRLFWLAIGSWIYRLHYVLWYIMTGGVWSNSDFSGAFDKLQSFAFFLPCLAIVQIWIFFRLPDRLEQRSRRNLSERNDKAESENF